jgi:hypothetical protein
MGWEMEDGRWMGSVTGGRRTEYHELEMVEYLERFAGWGSVCGHVNGEEWDKLGIHFA